MGIVHGKHLQAVSSDAVVPSGGTKSPAVDISEYAIIGLLIPEIDSANITFEVTEDEIGGTYYTLKEKDGTTYTVTAGAGNFAVASDELAVLAAYSYVKIVLSAEQSQARTFKWLSKS